MNYRIVERAPFTVAGRMVTSSLDNNIIPQFWDTCKKDGTIDRLVEIGVSPNTLGLCFGYDEEGNNDYMAGIETQQETIPDMQTTEIPGSRWLVFEAIGPIPGTLAETWRRIYGEFLPQSIYKQSSLPTIEVYHGNDTSDEDYKVEVWIPIEQE